MNDRARDAWAGVLLFIAVVALAVGGIAAVRQQPTPPAPQACGLQDAEYDAVVARVEGELRAEQARIDGVLVRVDCDNGGVVDAASRDGFIAFGSACKVMTRGRTIPVESLAVFPQ